MPVASPIAENIGCGAHELANTDRQSAVPTTVCMRFALCCDLVRYVSRPRTCATFPEVIGSGHSEVETGPVASRTPESRLASPAITPSTGGCPAASQMPSINRASVGKSGE